MYRNFFIITVIFTFSFADNIKKPLYQYRYETEDVMKTDASSIPVRGYHMVQGGYYPDRDFEEYSGDFGRLGRFKGNYYPPLSATYGASGFVGDAIPPLYGRGVGGEYVDKQAYSEGNEEVDDGSFEKASGKKGGHSSKGQAGFNEDASGVQKSKGDSGYYNAEQAEKKSSEDEKEYHGDQRYNEEGKQGGEKNQKSSHKKGHVIKGFKTSHHKDEDGKTEEFYDEAHDEGGDYKFDGKSGSYGEKSGSSYKGGHDNGQIHTIENKKKGQFDSKQLVDKANAEKEQYDQKIYYSNGEAYGVQNGVDQHSILGHQEANKIFKNYPYNVPFFSNHF